MILLSGPAIARLLLCSRMTANERMRAGAFGPLIRRGRIAYADLAGVEQYAGTTYSEAQVELAVAGRPDRRIVLNPETEEIA